MSGDQSIVGTWGATTTVAQGANSRVDETYLVLGSDKTVRDFLRTVIKSGNNTTSISQCGSGTYVFANGSLSTTIQEKSSPPANPPNTITKTVTGSAKVELIDGSMRLTSDVDGSPNTTVYSRGTLPVDIESSCPQ
ncbi:MAG TPA: hypothetical protein VLT33_32660 [Labilithrix sp.]|nr:hypothetical protein [Labilithrix sp.]